MTEVEFRNMYINAVGRWKLKPFMKKNIYLANFIGFSVNSIKQLNWDEKQLVFAPASLILTN